MKKQKIIKENQQKPGKLPLLIGSSILLFLAACYFIFPGFKNAVHEIFHLLVSKDDKKIEAWVQKFGVMGPLVLILIMMIQMFLFVVPNILVMIISIVIYGPLWGSVISLAGVFCSSSLGYLLGRYLGPVTVNKLIKTETQIKISDFIEHYGVVAISITRLASLSNDSLSIVAGLLKMSYRRYILATLAGIIPLIVLLAIYGRNGKIERALIWIAGVSLVLFVAYVFIDKKRKAKASRSTKKS
jgi:uncharacterized membrane protein YdjX (TVP38/TMEM64 family)